MSNFSVCKDPFDHFVGDFTYICSLFLSQLIDSLTDVYLYINNSLLSGEILLLITKTLVIDPVKIKYIF